MKARSFGRTSLQAQLAVWFLAAVAAGVLAPSGRSQSVPEPDHQKQANQQTCPKKKDKKDGEPVVLFTGNLEIQETDLTIAGRREPFAFTRTYRSGTTMVSSLGHHWDFNFNQQIKLVLPQKPDCVRLKVEYKGPYTGGPSTTGEGGGVAAPFSANDDAPSSEDREGSPQPQAPPTYIGTWMYYDGATRIDLFEPPTWEAPRGLFCKLQPKGIAGKVCLYGTTFELPKRFLLRFADGTIHTFSYLGDPSYGLVEYRYRLTKIETRHGDRIDIVYEGGKNPFGLGSYRVWRIYDTFGRSIDFKYDAKGWLKKVVDFDGRQVKYEHDAIGNLLSATTPAVVGTSTGNDFPEGKTRAYEYDTEGRHRVVAVADANEVEQCRNTPGCTQPTPYLTNEYLGSTTRVHKQVYGGTNGSGLPAGGTYIFLHGLIFEDWGPHTNIYRVVRIDPNGNVEATIFDTEGYDIETIQFTGRFDPETIEPDEVLFEDLIDWSNPSIPPSLVANASFGYEAPLRTGPNADPPAFRTYKTYNQDSLVETITLPEGNYVHYEYDETSPDVFQRANLLFEERWNALGNEAIRTGFAYEPLYNQVRAIFEPRGLDPVYTPPNGATPHGPARYMTEQLFDYQEGDLGSGEVAALVSEWQIDMNQASMIAALDTWMGAIPNGNWSVPIGAIQGGMSDLNGDGRTDQTAGNRIVQVVPDVQVYQDPTLEAPTYVTQAAEHQWQFNDFSLMTSASDPVGDVMTYSYYAENLPGGVGILTPDPTDGSKVLRMLSGIAGQDGGGHLLQVDRPEGATSSYARDELGRVTVETDPRGFQTLTAWNALHQIENVTVKRDGFPALNQLNYSTSRIYDANDNLVELRIDDVAPGFVNGVPTAESLTGTIQHFYTYDLLDNQVRRNMQADAQTRLVTEYRYDKNNARVLTLKPESIKPGTTMPTNVDSVIFDERGLTWKQTHGGLDPSFSLAAHAAIPEWTLGSTADTSTVEHDYDSNGNLVTRTDGEGHATTYEYDGFDRLRAVVDAASNRTEHTLDDDGNTVETEVRGEDGHGGANVLLARTLTSFDERRRAYQVDRELDVIDDGYGAYVLDLGLLTPNDDFITTRHQFDADSRLTRVVDDNVHSQTRDYDGLDRLTKTTDDVGNETKYYYDHASNLTRKEETDVSTSGAPSESFTTWVFRDELGRRVARVDELGHAHRWMYDSRSNLVLRDDAQDTASLSLSSLDPYGERGDLSGGPSVNGHGNTIVHTYDDANRRLTTERHLRASGIGSGAVTATVATASEYDLNSRLVKRIDANGEDTAYEYDELDRKTKTVYADMSEREVTAYDRDHLPVDVVDPNGSTFSHVYDAVHRLNTRTAATAAAGTIQQTFAHDGLRHVTGTTDDNGAEVDEQVIYAYDTLGRRISEVHAGQRILCEFDGVGNATNLTYDAAGGRSLAMTYDAIDRLETVVDGGSTIATYDHIGTRRLEHRTLGDGVSDLVDLQCGYDAARRRTDHVQLDPQNPGAELAGFRYGHDRVHNRVWEERTHDLDEGRVWIYDSLYRMVHEKRDVADPPAEAATPGSGGTIGSYDQFTLDGAHNFDLVDENGTVYDNDFDATNAYTSFKSVTQARDANGNRTQDGNRSFEYDAFNRLIVVKDGTTEIARHTYDAENRRKTRILPTGTSIRYVYRGWDLLEERDLNGVGTPLVRQYVCGAALDEPLQLRDFTGGPSADYLYMTDALGSIVGLVGGPGTVTQRTKYDAYGTPEHTTAVPVENPLLFTGAYYDLNTGLYYFRNRFYDPEQGRFISRDPIGPWEDAANLGNAYSYVGSNPVLHRDPLGLEKEKKKDGEIKPPPGGRVEYTSQGAIVYDENGAVVDRQPGATPPDGGFVQQTSQGTNVYDKDGKLVGRIGEDGEFHAPNQLGETDINDPAFNSQAGSPPPAVLREIHAHSKGTSPGDRFSYEVGERRTRRFLNSRGQITERYVVEVVTPQVRFEHAPDFLSAQTRHTLEIINLLGQYQQDQEMVQMMKVTEKVLHDWAWGLAAAQGGAAGALAEGYLNAKGMNDLINEIGSNLND